MKKMFPWLLLALILFSQIVMSLYYGNLKNGFHVDEFYTFGHANGYPKGDIFEGDDLDFGRRFEAEYFKNHFQVQKDERFSYDKTYLNVREHLSAHPPLYYMIIHTMSSLNYENFSKWQGIMPNVLFSAATVVLLYFIALEITKNKYYSLIPAAVWGFSAGAMSSVVFIRMYFLLTVIFLTITLCHSKIINNAKNINIKMLVALFFLNILCFMTHYYSLVFIFFLAAFFCFYLLVTKKIRSLFKYMSTVILSLAVAYVIHPGVITSIFFSDRGQQSLKKIQSFSTFFTDLRDYYDVINRQLFAESFPYLVLILLIMLVAIIIKKRKSFKKLTKKLFLSKLVLTIRENKMLLLVLPTISLYLLVITKVAPAASERYIMPVFPLIILSIYLIFVGLGYRLVNNKKISNLAFCLIFAAVIIYSHQNKLVTNVYRQNNPGEIEALDQYYDYTAYYFYNSKNSSYPTKRSQITSASNYMGRHAASYLIDISQDYDSVLKLINENSGTESAMLYFVNNAKLDKELDIKPLIKRITTDKECSEATEILTVQSTDGYLMENCQK